MKYWCFAFAALLATSPVFAQTRAQQFQQKLEARFQAADADHDGKLTRQEAQGGMPFVSKHFDQIDTTHQGYVTLADIERYFVQLHNQRQQGQQAE